MRDLAEATHAVAEGDYSRRLAVASEDELGFLARSFNDMTRRLARSREQDALRGRQQIEGQRAYLEAVLANLSSGVISMGADSVVRAVNRTAQQASRYRCPASSLGQGAGGPGSGHHELLEPFVDAVLRHREQGDCTWEQEECLCSGEQWPPDIDVPRHSAWRRAASVAAVWCSCSMM